MAMAPSSGVTRKEPAVGGRIGLHRHFTTEGTHPYDQVSWERRTSRITNYRDASVAFEQLGVEVPVGWSLHATNILAQKYFRGAQGTPERETSLRQVADRVVDTIAAWGRSDGYFADEAEAEAFADELKYLIVTQRGAFNSPVWFNIGAKGRKRQASACFILSVDDTMDSILNWYVEEGTIFKGGSGAGVNLSRIRSSAELLKGGGTASGPVSFMRGADASAGTIKCLHADTPIVTDRGVVAIRSAEPGARVLTRFGYQPIEDVHDNGVRPVVRVRTSLGDELVCTPEHRFRVLGSDGKAWREAGSLRADDHLLIDLDSARHGLLPPLEGVARGHHNEIPHRLPSHLDEGFAMWLGWIYGDGSVTSRPAAKFIAVQIGDDDSQLVERYQALTRSVFGDDTHFFVDRHQDKADASLSVRFSSSEVIRFLERNGLRKDKASQLRVPSLVQAAPGSVRAAFLAGLFEADGHVTNGYPGLSTVSRDLAHDVHRLLLSIGIPSSITRCDTRQGAYGTLPMYGVRIVGGEGVRRFAKLVGFISDRKHHRLEAAVERKAKSPFETQWFLPHVQRELSLVWESTPDQRLRRAIAPYCRYQEPRAMSLLRARALLERFPSELGGTSLVRFAMGDDLYVTATVEEAGEAPTFDLTVKEVHEYLVNGIVTHNSGGATRRAAKMVILNADHPDIEDFIWCKAVEERKARVLREAGFDMDLDGKDSHSTQYQNANNSVRVTDEFMQAVVDDGDWHLRAVTTGDVVRTVKARDLMHQISQSTWECADPGMQFDTTINRWHTAANTGRINGSNPCCFVGETLIETTQGLVAIDRLATMSDEGQPLPGASSFDVEEGVVKQREIIKAWVAGYTTELVEVRTRRGIVVRCTADHRFLTSTGEYRAAGTLEPGLQLRSVEGSDSVARVEHISIDEPVAVYDLEVEGTHNFAVASPAAGAGEDRAIVVHNSEYMHLDNSACNLASINLLAFLDEEENRFDVEGFQHAVELFFTAQEILVGNADYPTEAIAENSRRFRQLGLGYANLGALLMALGLPYDSDAGRAWAGALTAILTGHAYAISARTAARMGPFAGYTENQEHMLRVLRMHRDELAHIDADLVPVELLEAAKADWDDAVVWGETFGVRNSQASVLAPTGCLTGGSLVTTERGLVRLRSLGDPNGPQWQDLGLGVATDEGVRQASQFYVNGLERVVDVVTARGHRIQGTTTHRVKIVDQSGAWVWRRMADLEPGDRVPLALGRLVGSPQHVALPPLAEAYWTGEHHARAPRRMSVELAELVGYFMGDGSLHSRGLRFCVADADLDVIDRLRVLGKELFGLEAHVKQNQGYNEVAFHSVRLVAWWEACGLAKHQPSPGHTGKGWTSHIPDAVLHTNDPAVYAGFVRGLFEADGTVTAGYPCWTTTSLDFSHEVQSLLLALGFPTTRRFCTSGRGSALAVLRLMNVSQGQRWTEEIGFLGNRKNAAAWSTENRQSARYDHIPLTRAMVDQLVPENGRLRRVLLMELARGRVSRRIATELYEATRDAELGHLLDFFYDTVASATLGDEELTYDLSVPDNVTYVANGFVSHNTIGLLMDCDTTGVEPDLGLCKMKKLVGGGTMTIVNQTVPRALRRLGYAQPQVDEIVAYIDEHKTILGAPHLAPEHVPVFACSMGDNAIHYQGHIRMMGAVQHWISGAISKTVNMPEEATVEDVEQLHIDAWKLGIKAVAIYRDNCKVAQPLSMAKKEIKPEELVAAVEAAVEVAPAQVVERIVEKVVMQPVRKKLPRNRRSRTFEFRVADCKGFVTVGEYDDGRPGELFLRVSKQGSTLAGIMDAFAISVSHGLQYGVPLKAFIEAFTNMRFEPAGMTDDADIRFASSLVDYIFRRLAVDYLPLDERMELGILSVGERHNPTLPGIEEAATESSAGLDVLTSPPIQNTTAADLDPVTTTAPAPALSTARPANRDAPYCMQCGVQMIRAGSCHACPSCGTTSGCS